jgi:hypothetical protein
MSAIIKNALVITSFHRDLYAAANAGFKATSTMMVKMETLIRSKYTVAPSFEQYRADQAALAEVAKEKGLVDNQWVRKPYAAAIKSVFGALPESQDPAAVAKRNARGKKAPGPVKGETSKKAPAETIEQLIARVGVFKVLAMCADILEVESTTKDVAKTIRAIKVAA